MEIAVVFVLELAIRSLGKFLPSLSIDYRNCAESHPVRSTPARFFNPFINIIITKKTSQRIRLQARTTHFTSRMSLDPSLSIVKCDQFVRFDFLVSLRFGRSVSDWPHNEIPEIA